MLLDVLFREGLVGFFVPFILPGSLNLLLLFGVFAALSWIVTKWFCKSDKIGLSDLGISFSTRNRFDFLFGFLVGLGLWAIVSISQSYAAGFSWELRPNLSVMNLLYGLIFIFIADLGTELFYRAYPLTMFKDSFGAIGAVTIMVFFVGLKSYSSDVEGELLLYIMLIPALHTIFFSFIYFKTRRLGAALGVHTGANWVTISIFDLRIEQAGQAIPSGIFQANVEVDALSLAALQLPWVFMALAFSIAAYFWWVKNEKSAVSRYPFRKSARRARKS